MQNLENFKEKIRQLYANFKTKMAALGIGAAIVLTVVNTCAEKIPEAVTEPFKNVEIEDCVVTPIYNENLPLASGTLQEVRDYSEMYGSDILTGGFTANLFLRNNESKPISISESAIVIDDIEKTENPQVYLFGVYDDKDNLFSIYLINNSLENFDEGIVEIVASYYDEITKQNVELTDERIGQMFNSEADNPFPITFKNLSGGEIRKSSSYKLDLDIFENIECIDLKYNISVNKEIIQEGSFGSLMKINGSISYQFRAGDAGDSVINKYSIVDVEEDKGKHINIPTNFSISENNIQSLSYTIYPTSSCILTFHVEIKCANSIKRIKSGELKQEIYVPLYEDDDCFWWRLREFIKKYNIDTYYYSSNPIIQKEIDYFPQNSGNNNSSSNSMTDTYDPNSY